MPAVKTGGTTPDTAGIVFAREIAGALLGPL